MGDARKQQRFEALARPEFDALFRTSLRIVGRRAIAEEVVQEACLRAYADFDVADEPAAFRPWLFRIAVNLALDHLRRCKHEAVSFRNDGIDRAVTVPDTTLSGRPDALAEGRETGRAMGRALAMLTPDLRAVVVLVLIEEMSYAEAAVALAITGDLVRSRLSRARAELRRQLAHHGTDLTRQHSSRAARSIDQTTSNKRGPQ